MLTYTATNTKTGEFYIGSAKNYCHFMNRKGNHHVGHAYNKFREDLQANPLDFIWDYSEDDLDDRSFEAALLEIYVGNRFCYNLSKRPAGCCGDPETVYRGGRKTPHTEETRAKMSASALKTSDIKSKTMTKMVTSKEPCPHCGKLMNPGNLKQHLRAMTCQK